MPLSSRCPAQNPARGPARTAKVTAPQAVDDSRMSPGTTIVTGVSTDTRGTAAPHTDWVELDGQRVPLAKIRSTPDRFIKLLSAARTHKQALCLCRTPALRLVTRCSRTTGRHHLAVWPGQGSLHDPECAFHRLDPELSGQGSYDSAAIRDLGDGVAIRFAAPLVSKSGEDRPQPIDSQSCPGLGRRSVGLLGLLHWLWDESGLSAWSPRSRTRNWAAVSAAVTEQLAGTTISRQPAESVLHVVPPYNAETADANLAEFDEWLASLRTNTKQIRRGFVLGEIKAVRESKYGVRYQLAHQNPARGIFVSERLDALLRRRHRHPFADASDTVGGRKIGLFYIERSPGGYATAVDAAVMLTSARYIPADSSYEVQMADALIAAGRAFVKPLRYDGDTVFPDFVLTDTAVQTVIEVWGLPGRESYEARKATKLLHYQRSGTPLIEWTVTDHMPDVHRQ